MKPRFNKKRNDEFGMMSLENILSFEEQRIGSSKAGKMSSFLSSFRQYVQKDDIFMYS